MRIVTLFTLESQNVPLVNETAIAYSEFKNPAITHPYDGEEFVDLPAKAANCTVYRIGRSEYVLDGEQVNTGCFLAIEPRFEEILGCAVNSKQLNHMQELLQEEEEEHRHDIARLGLALARIDDWNSRPLWQRLWLTLRGEKV